MLNLGIKRVVKKSIFSDIFYPDGDGGAIRITSGDDIAINYCRFNKISCSGSGGCIYFASSNMEISTSCFSVCFSTTRGNNIKKGNAIFVSGTGVFTLTNANTYLCSYSSETGCDSSIKSVSKINVDGFNATNNYGLGGGSCISCSSNSDYFKFINAVDGEDDDVVESFTHYEIYMSNFINSTRHHNCIYFGQSDNCITFNTCIFVNPHSKFSYGDRKCTLTNCVSNKKITSFAVTTTAKIKTLTFNAPIQYCQATIIEYDRCSCHNDINSGTIILLLATSLLEE